MILSPAPCLPSHWLLIMVSSRPAHRDLRAAWRERRSLGVKLVFLVAQGEEEGEQEALRAEHEEHQDIVEVGVKDGHRLLAYKILTGHAWAYHHCSSARHVAKSDDNVQVDMAGLERVLQRGEREDWENVISCPTVAYNAKVKRSSSGGMTGGWSESREDWQRDTLPVFCVGFLSLTTPSLGAQLAQVGLELYRDREAEVVQIEDSLITGVLRERLPHVRIEVLHSGLPLWNSLTSHCPWTHMFKQTFFNDLVISKKSSRNNVHYVGSVTNLQLWKFFLCVTVEGALEMVQAQVPSLVPDFLWSVCSR